VKKIRGGKDGHFAVSEEANLLGACNRGENPEEKECEERLYDA